MILPPREERIKPLLQKREILIAELASLNQEINEIYFDKADPLRYPRPMEVVLTEMKTKGRRPYTSCEDDRWWDDKANINRLPSEIRAMVYCLPTFSEIEGYEDIIVKMSAEEIALRSYWDLRVDALTYADLRDAYVSYMENGGWNDD